MRRRSTKLSAAERGKFQSIPVPLGQAHTGQSSPPEAPSSAPVTARERVLVLLGWHMHGAGTQCFPLGKGRLKEPPWGGDSEDRAGGTGEDRDGGDRVQPGTVKGGKGFRGSVQTLSILWNFPDPGWPGLKPRVECGLEAPVHPHKHFHVSVILLQPLEHHTHTSEFLFSDGNLCWLTTETEEKSG